MKLKERVQAIIFGITGYSILLIQQIPGIWVWIPLMAAPVILLLGALISNFPTSLFDAYDNFFILKEVFFGKILIVLSTVIIIYSIIYLGITKKNRLVTSGPYRFVRHPQYTGFLLLTIGFTSWCHFYIINFFGTSWVSADATIALWYIEFLAYIILAFVEDKYLLKKFGKEYDSYRAKTPLFIPFSRTGMFDYVISILSFSLLLYVAIQFPLL